MRIRTKGKLKKLGTDPQNDSAGATESSEHVTPLPDLLPEHQTLLSGSAVDPKVAAARGYRSIEDPAELRALGFAPVQQRVPGLLVPVHDVHGTVATHQYRPDNPRKNKAGRAIMYETPTGSRMVLDVPPPTRQRLINSDVPLWITEGSRKADAAVSAGLCCVALLGFWNWRGTNYEGGKNALSDWESIALNDREVVIAFDSDVTGKVAVQQGLTRLGAFLKGRGAKVKIVRIPAAPEDAQVGLDDYLAASGSVDDLLAQAAPLECRPMGTKGAGSPTQGQVLLQLIEKANEGFQIGSMGTVYVALRFHGHLVNWSLRGESFKRWAKAEFHKSEGKLLGSQTLNDVLGLLEGRAQEEQPVPCEVPIRVAVDDVGAVWLDLCDPDWRAARITATGWSIEDNPPVRFRRVRGMQNLPSPYHRLPDHGESYPHPLQELRQFVNVSDNDWPLLLAWLVAAFFPTGPYPLLILQGEQGSGKSTAARVLRELIDPNRSPVRSLPRKEDDLLIAANQGWILAYDNLSGLSAQMSDALCRLATGGGISKRQLYTDADEVILEATRPVILNGIEDPVRRGDLADRSIVLNFPRIPDGEYQPEEIFWKKFAEARPHILGALLDAVSMALRRLDDVTPKVLPRMADFARRVIAAEPALPWAPGSFLVAYDANRANVREATIEGDQVVQALLAFLDYQDGKWSGTASELLAELDERVEHHIKVAKGWPKDATRLGGRLRRAAPLLRKSGVQIEFIHQGQNKTRVIQIRTDALDSARGARTHATLAVNGSPARVGARPPADASAADADAVRVSAKPAASVRRDAPAGTSHVARSASDAAGAGVRDLFFGEEDDEARLAQIIQLNNWNAEDVSRARMKARARWTRKTV